MHRAKWRLEMGELREYEMRGRGGDHLFKHHKKGGGWGWPQGGFHQSKVLTCFTMLLFCGTLCNGVKVQSVPEKREEGGRWSNRCHDWNPLPFSSSSSLHLSQYHFSPPFWFVGLGITQTNHGRKVHKMEIKLPNIEISLSCMNAVSKSRQKWIERAGTKFTKPEASNFADFFKRLFLLTAGIPASKTANLR